MTEPNEDGGYNRPDESIIEIEGTKLVARYLAINESGHRSGVVHRVNRSITDRVLLAAVKFAAGARRGQPSASVPVLHHSITAIEAVVAATTFGPFVTAFCTELGKRFGGSISDWASKIRLRQKASVPSEADLLVELDNVVTVVELEKDLPDEARLAFLDLDLKAPAIRGRRLRWNAEGQAWEPTG